MTNKLTTAAFLLALAMATSARAVVVNCGPTPNHTEYDVKGSQIEVTVHHPFKVFRGSSHTATGTMLVNPENLQDGISLRISLPLKGLEVVDAPAQNVLASVLASVGDAGFEYFTQVVDIPQMTKAVPSYFKIRMVGELSFRGASLPAVIPADCTVEAEFWKCNFAFLIRLSDFGLPGPMLIKVPSRDSVNVKGELTLGPKRET